MSKTVQVRVSKEALSLMARIHGKDKRISDYRERKQLIKEHYKQKWNYTKYIP